MPNLKLHTKIEVTSSKGMWCETHLTTPISIFQNVIQKGKGISTYQSS